MIQYLIFHPVYYSIEYDQTPTPMSQNTTTEMSISEIQSEIDCPDCSQDYEYEDEMEEWGKLSMSHSARSYN